LVAKLSFHRFLLAQFLMGEVRTMASLDEFRIMMDEIRAGIAYPTTNMGTAILQSA